MIKNYGACYENLQLYLRLKLKVKQIHRVFALSQSQWLRPYI